jgi:hypothetical protein
MSDAAGRNLWTRLWPPVQLPSHSSIGSVPWFAAQPPLAMATSFVLNQNRHRRREHLK